MVFCVIIPISILVLTIVLHFMFRSKTIQNIHGYHIVVSYFLKIFFTVNIPSQKNEPKGMSVHQTFSLIQS